MTSRKDPYITHKHVHAQNMITDDVNCEFMVTVHVV